MSLCCTDLRAALWGHSSRPGLEEIPMVGFCIGVIVRARSSHEVDVRIQEGAAAVPGVANVCAGHSPASRDRHQLLEMPHQIV